MENYYEIVITTFFDTKLLLTFILFNLKTTKVVSQHKFF
jgi:hypothetical protein